MLSQILQFFYSRVLIGIDLDYDSCRLNILRLHGGRVKQNISREIKMIDGLIPMEVVKLLYFYKKKFPFTYISAMSKDTTQGALPTINPKDFLDFGVSSQGVKALSINQHCSCYIQQDKIFNEIRRFEEIGYLDFLFSPFTLLFEESKKIKEHALYLLQQKENIAIMIANHQQVISGRVVSLDLDAQQTPQNFYTSDISSNTDSIENILDFLDQGFEDPLDELFDEAFASDEDLQEFAQEQEQQEKDKIEALRDFMRATKVVEAVENIIKEYYASNQSQFLQKVILFDTYGMAPDALKHLQDVLMLDIDVREYNVAQALLTLAQKEFDQQ
ncbi:hypothetical protein BBW65_05125 [Helicobacter enhydrae]|uniref:Uncharacterized protein n=1 Tax=Helicobacter enhydrae TaxID=222136 RepID=A0A1B1U635_9HELI|nr:hypothetical protein [Helicobacter enhydrae]ANV98219.1 hypothetical protein BBW65_05125 [Helicobacter enhydrae]